MKNKIVAIFNSRQQAENAVAMSKRQGCKLKKVSITVKGDREDVFNNSVQRQSDSNYTRINMMPYAPGDLYAYDTYRSGFAGFQYGTTMIGFTSPYGDYDSMMSDVRHEMQPGKVVLTFVVEDGNNAKCCNIIRNCGAETIMETNNAV